MAISPLVVLMCYVSSSVGQHKLVIIKLAVCLAKPYSTSVEIPCEIAQFLQTNKRSGGMMIDFFLKVVFLSPFTISSARGEATISLNGVDAMSLFNSPTLHLVLSC